MCLVFIYDKFTLPPLPMMLMYASIPHVLTYYGHALPLLQYSDKAQHYHHCHVPANFTQNFTSSSTLVFERVKLSWTFEP